MKNLLKASMLALTAVVMSFSAPSAQALSTPESDWHAFVCPSGTNEWIVVELSFTQQTAHEGATFSIVRERTGNEDEVVVPERPMPADHTVVYNTVVLNNMPGDHYTVKYQKNGYQTDVGTYLAAQCNGTTLKK